MKPKGHLTALGVVLSAAVVAVVLLLCFVVAPWPTEDFGPAVWAAILATVFTGLAFAWLVVAYYQQGHSLELFYQSEVQPVLIFFRPGEGPWRVRNVGKGPAVNVRIADGLRPGEWEAPSCVHLAAIAAGDELPVEWAVHAGALVAIYHDTAERTYTAECYRHVNTLANGDAYPDLKPARYEFDVGPTRRSRT